MSTPNDKVVQKVENRFTESHLYTLMPSKKPRVVVYLSEEMKAELDKWAEDERRTVNNLVNLLIEDALLSKRKNQNKSE